MGSYFRMGGKDKSSKNDVSLFCVGVSAFVCVSSLFFCCLLTKQISKSYQYSLGRADVTLRHAKGKNRRKYCVRMCVANAHTPIRKARRGKKGRFPACPTKRMGADKEGW